MSYIDLFSAPPEEEVLKKRDAAIEKVEANAGPEFGVKAREFILVYLREHGPTPGEELVIAAKNADIIPHDDRAFGSSFMSLSKKGLIMKAGSCVRKRGHLGQGGVIWSLT